MDNNMTINGFGCRIHMPTALTNKYDDNGEEIQHHLPPYAPVEVRNVDEYSCPSNWMHGSKIASSYFTGVKKDHGLWLDFNHNLNHTKDVAIVISIQGINPITGLPTDKLKLEQYDDKCPKHGCDFHGNRLCPQCGFKWPKQNYLASNSWPHGLFWLDGFRASDGKVRQYVFTDDITKGIAANIIGGHRVYAIGIAFFESRKPKPIPKLTHQPYDYKVFGGSSPLSYWHHATYSCASPILRSSNISARCDCSVNNTMNNIDEPPLEVKAGSQIRQAFYDDPNSLNHWQSEPSGIIYVNYCSVSQYKNIIQNGKRREIVDGFMAGIPVGN